MFSPDPKIIPSTWARAAVGGTAITRMSYSLTPPGENQALDQAGATVGVKRTAPSRLGNGHGGVVAATEPAATDLDWGILFGLRLLLLELLRRGK